MPNKVSAKQEVKLREAKGGSYVSQTLTFAISLITPARAGGFAPLVARRRSRQAQSGACETRSTNELNALRSARAALSAAEGRLVQDANTFQRQETLLASGFTTKVLFDQAQQGLHTAQAAVDDAKAQLEIAEDRVGYTELKATVAGTITARGAEAGEVSPHQDKWFFKSPGTRAGMQYSTYRAGDTLSSSRRDDYHRTNR